MPHVAPGIAPKRTMMRVTMPGFARTVSFQPASLAPGGIAAPMKRSLPLASDNRIVEAPAVENLEAHQVQMNRMRIVGEIDQLQISTVSSARLFGIGMSSASRSAASSSDSATLFDLFDSASASECCTASDSGSCGTGAARRASTLVSCVPLERTRNCITSKCFVHQIDASRRDAR